MARLNLFMASLNGFDDFRKGKQKSRYLSAQHQLTEERSEGTGNLCFVDTYVKAHLLDPKNSALLSVRSKISTALSRRGIDPAKNAGDLTFDELATATREMVTIVGEIAKANLELTAYVNENKVLDAYSSIKRECTRPDLPGVIYTCEKLARGPLSLPGEREDATFDHCYRGPDHLSCKLAAKDRRGRRRSLGIYVRRARSSPQQRGDREGRKRSKCKFRDYDPNRQLGCCK
jgi:hypothetical protein